MWVSLFGTAKQYGSMMSLAHPEVDVLRDPDEAKKFDTLIPIYPSNKHFSKAYISNKILTDWIRQLLDELEIQEFLPEAVLHQHNFPYRKQALETIHTPEERKDAHRALDRFKFEELFLFELSMIKMKQVRIERSKAAPLQAGEVLPFELTEGQISALSDIKSDLKSGYQMNRLLQGDVGAGKTVVAIGAMLMAVDSGFQAGMMAPTEILAEQHYHTLQEYLGNSELNIRLLTGNQRSSLRNDILSDIAGGSCHITVGTHAIFQEQVRFNKLGLVVIDEQHRFGVRQRNEFMQKGDHPHLLVMSATPIPRSLAMSLYSDLDISAIRQLPSGRKPIKTAVRFDKDREGIYNFVRQQVSEGEQVYVIYPLIEESEVMDLKDATQGYEKLKKRFPEFSVDLLHGRLDSSDKEEIMKRFADGKTDILVSTTVVEVGVDVPNATIMMIEHAERFGLSQLHQLRGRIGRGQKQSYCILLPDRAISKSGKFRMKKMAETTDGFEIAEADLKLRGPGDFLGTKQSGLPDFRYADIVEDRWILEQAKESAGRILREDPDLQRSGHTPLLEVFKPYFKERAEYLGIG
jgi:ATP-dependent DNA helicase RecG